MPVDPLFDTLKAKAGHDLAQLRMEEKRLSKRIKRLEKSLYSAESRRTTVEELLHTTQDWLDAISKEEYPSGN